MLKKVEMREAVGKTIKSVYFSNWRLVLTFEDGTYADVEMDENMYDSDSSVLADGEEVVIDPTLGKGFHVNNEHVSAGIITRDEYNAAFAALKWWQAQEDAKREREQYEMLKQKFGEDGAKEFLEVEKLFHG